ncbi:XAC2610-related protein [Pedobacter africanus]|uniref:Uncharacterized protein n=1 Tax=Pedobacter africanus TaxID=151894 RepID=A0ACC6KUK1_9SPHI|nr:hypothetical protein [Pedobacter africanus]MDR6782776.1 hypothetical protein [Pedobacter africanus]
MKLWLAFILLLCTTNVFAQTVFRVDDFSKEYYGKIVISDTTETSPGWVGIYKRSNNKRIIKVNATRTDWLLWEVESEGRQNAIIYKDFNFDGLKDFAVQDGYHSCYNAPSFAVYLATPKGFVFNNDFTRLTQNYCGMFQIDKKTKTISNTTKSGCCWHEYSTFKVNNNMPRAIKVVTEDCRSLESYCRMRIQKWNGKRMVIKKSIKLNTNRIDTIFSFIVPENGKRILLFTIDNQLEYALFDKTGAVEFTYPYGAGDNTSGFRFYADKNRRLEFSNKKVRYAIFERTDGIGITIWAKGKTYCWEGEMETRKGGLYKYTTMGFDNVAQPPIHHSN